MAGTATNKASSRRTLWMQQQLSLSCCVCTAIHKQKPGRADRLLFPCLKREFRPSEEEASSKTGTESCTAGKTTTTTTTTTTKKKKKKATRTRTPERGSLPNRY